MVAFLLLELLLIYNKKTLVPEVVDNWLTLASKYVARWSTSGRQLVDLGQIQVIDRW